MPTYNLINKKTGETKTEQMKISEMVNLTKDTDWEIDMSCAKFPAMTSDGGLGLRKPDDGFRDLLGEMKKHHNPMGGNVKDHK